MRRWLKRAGRPRGALPGFLVIGAQKSGTSYLYHNLVQQHPFVQGALNGEVHFFNTREREGGEAAYRERFPPKVDGKVMGEKSPNYLHFLGTAKQAHKIVPEASIIALLRNPVDRAYSHYHHSIRLGREALSFEEALEKEPERIAVDPEAVAFRAFSYAAKGIYVDQLAEWFQFFDRARALVIKSEDMYANPQEVFVDVQRFLGVPEQPLNLGKKNRHKRVYPAPMRPETHERLGAYFQPHNERLYEYLGRDFGW